MPEIERLVVWSLWLVYMTSARTQRFVSAETVQELIAETRGILSREGYSSRQSDLVMFEIYTAVHWDWDQPTDRVFEALLEFEIEDFWKARM